MFKIYDGRDKFYQWDLDRKLIVEDNAITEVHFCNRTDNCSLVCETFVEDGLTLVNVPNILLQTDWKIHVYAYDGSYTKHAECYEVVSRTKPADYVYTETEIKTWKYVEQLAYEALDKANNSVGNKTADGGEIFNNYENNVASGYYSHAEGYNTRANGANSHTEGNKTYANGENAHAEGFNSIADANNSHAEGYSTIAKGISSHTEGRSTVTTGLYSHAEGQSTKADGDNSHAEGYSTTAQGSASHTEGSCTIASAKNAHAEGYYTEALGAHAHAEGCGTIASGKASHTQGKYNINDTENKYAHIVGNGSDTKNRSNAHTLDWEGNAWFAGDVVAGDVSLTTINNTLDNKVDKYYKQLFPTLTITEEDIANAGDEGITELRIGDDNSSIMETINELYIHMCVPASKDINSANSPLHIMLANSTTAARNQEKAILYAQSTSYAPLDYSYTTNYVIKSVFAKEDKTLMYTEFMRNGFAAASYPQNALATVPTSNDNRKSLIGSKAIIINAFQNTTHFKFPVGTTITVCGR